MTCPEDGCLAGCGDGLVQANEACDDGNLSNTDACLDTYQPASCGDGFVQDGIEACDDANFANTDACVMCNAPTCGDGFTWIGMEECDDANATSTDACDTTCKTVIHRKVFVSSIVTTGALDGLYGGDLMCQTLADAASLGGSFQAWLSDGTEGPAAVSILHSPASTSSSTALPSLTAGPTSQMATSVTPSTSPKRMASTTHPYGRTPPPEASRTAYLTASHGAQRRDQERLVRLFGSDQRRVDAGQRPGRVAL